MQNPYLYIVYCPRRVVPPRVRPPPPPGGAAGVLSLLRGRAGLAGRAHLGGFIY